MRHLFTIITFVFFGLMTACQGVQKKDNARGIVEEPISNQDKDDAAQLIKKAVKAHGGALYEKAHYQFVFRGKQYTFNNQKGYAYTVSGKDDSGYLVIDSLVNGHLSRRINSEVVRLSKKDITKYTEALNSVIYFATLPHKLLDKSVKPEYLGEAAIKDVAYKVVKVSFEKNGGGTDYDDVFCYWVNQKTSTIDYLVYSYKTNGGGVRFRSAYNPRMVDGIRFQDYVNWEAPLGTNLEELPELYENSTLKELSRIATEAVINLNSTVLLETENYRKSD